MKRYNKIKFNKYIPLLEGKKQAFQMLQKAFQNTEVEHKVKLYLDALTELDPTSPKNKYVELFAKLFIDYVNSTMPKNVNIGFEEFKSKLYADKIQEVIKSIEQRNLKIDLSKIKTYDDFKKELDKTASKITKSIAKKGITGLKAGKDYIEIPLKDDMLQAYIPLHYKASQIIASNRVGRCEGQWCTAYQKTDKYWISYIEDEGGILVYIINNDPNADEEDLKQAIYFYENSGFEGFDANDHSTRALFDGVTIEKYVRSHWDNIRSKMKLPTLKERAIQWLENQDLNKGESLHIAGDTVVIKTNGFNNGTNSFIEDILSQNIYQAVSGDLYDNFYYENYTNRSTAELIEFYQDNVKSKQAINEVIEKFPGLYDVDYNDDTEIEEWENNQTNDIEDLNRVINRSEEFTWFDKAYEIMEQQAVDNLDKVFSVDIQNLDEINLTVPLSDILDLGVRPYIIEEDSLSNFLVEQTDINRDNLDDRAISYIYADPAQNIEDTIINYGID